MDTYYVHCILVKMTFGKAGEQEQIEGSPLA